MNYFQWARELVDGAGWAHAGLAAALDQLYARRNELERLGHKTPKSDRMKGCPTEICTLLSLTTHSLRHLTVHRDENCCVKLRSTSCWLTR